jgi:hypothetical protein
MLQQPNHSALCRLHGLIASRQERGGRPGPTPAVTEKRNTPEHDPEKWERFSEKAMLKQEDEIMIRFNLIGS